MNKPVSETERQIAEQVEKLGFTPSFTGFEDPDPEAYQLIRELAAVDYLYGGDTFRFEFGGDGDSGEWLAILLSFVLKLRKLSEEHDTKR